jgi:succinoglycan biosynthesis transport protein ExoP
MAMAGVSGASLPGTKKNKPIDIIRFLRRNIATIIVIGNFGFTLLAPFALLAIKPFYKASSRLKIEPVVQSILGNSEETSILRQYTDFIWTQTNQMRDVTLLEKAIKKLTPKQRNALFPQGLPDRDCAAMLSHRLYIQPVSRTYLIDIALQGDNPEGLAAIINNIMDVYKKEVDTRKRAQNDHRLEYLRSERDSLGEQIIEKQTKLRGLAKLTNTSSFSEQFNFYFKRAEQLQKAYVELYLKLVDAEHLYGQRLKEKIEISKLLMEPQVEEMVANDWGLDSTQSWTYQKMQEMRSSLDGLTEENLERKYTEERMKSMRKYELDMTEEVRELARKVMYGKRNYDLEKKLIEAKSQYDSIKTSMEDISLKLETAKKEAADNSERLIVGEQIQAELGHMRQLLFGYEKRINDLVVQANVASRISISVKARKPKSQSGSNAKKLFMVCLVLPFGLITFILFVIEFMDNRITRPKNIVSALGYPSTWPISRAPAGVAFSRVTLDAPSSVASKALRSLALRLHRDSARNNTKLFLFNGVDLQSGTTEIILNTAHHLGQMLPSVLVIEATSSHPTLRKLLNIPADQPGFSDVLTGKTTLEDAIYTDFERNVNFIFSSEPAYALEASLVFQSVMKEIRKNFDLILIDSTQIMKSDFTEYLGMHSDVVIMVIQGDRTLYRSVREIAQLFMRLEVPAMASVLNWGGAKYTTRFEKFLEKPYLKFILDRLSNKNDQ